MLLKIDTCIGFCVYRRSYLIWSPVIVVVAIVLVVVLDPHPGGFAGEKLGGVR